MENIQNMSNTEIVDYLVFNTAQLELAPENIASETEYPSEDLINILTLIQYLIVAEVDVDAEGTYSKLQTACEIELKRRLGDLPSTI